MVTVSVPWFRVGRVYGITGGADQVFIRPWFLKNVAVEYLSRVAGQDTIVAPVLRFVPDVLLRCTRMHPSETHS